MKMEVFPTQEELAEHAKLIPEIDPLSILAMLRIIQASEEIRANIGDVIEREYQISEGKLRVLIVLHQNPDGIAPSVLADKTGVTRATISVMTSRMARDGLVEIESDTKDKRGKILRLSEHGRAYLNQILPNHYLRISRLMGKLNREEQDEVIRLLQKLTT